MSTKSMPGSKGHPILRGALLGAEIGAAFGIALHFLYRRDFFGIPGSWILFGIVGGAAAGAIAAAFQSKNENRESKPHTNKIVKDDAKLQLKKEDLDISKRKVEKARVNTHIETITENKTVNVPVTREELVIEKTILNTKDEGDNTTETIRIPIREERVDIKKHPVELEDVVIYKNKVKDVVHIDETLKEEKLHVEAKGHAGYKVFKSWLNKKPK